MPLIAYDRTQFAVELGLNLFQFQSSTDYRKLMAGSVLSITPIFIVFLLLRRRIIEGVALTGLKGQPTEGRPHDDGAPDQDGRG